MLFCVSVKGSELGSGHIQEEKADQQPLGDGGADNMLLQ